MTLAELGAQLREERIRQDIVLEEAASRLKIAVRVLRAIEDGEEAELPHIVYVRGFIKSYSNLLGYTAEERADMLDGLVTETEEAPRLSTRSPSMDYHATRQKSRAFSLLLKVFLLTAIGVGAYVYYINNIREQGPEMANWELGQQVEEQAAQNAGKPAPNASPETAGISENSEQTAHSSGAKMEWEEAEQGQGAEEKSSGFFSFFTDLYDELFASSGESPAEALEVAEKQSSEKKSTETIPAKSADSAEGSNSQSASQSLSGTLQNAGEEPTGNTVVAPLDLSMGDNVQAPVNAVPSVKEGVKPGELALTSPNTGNSQPGANAQVPGLTMPNAIGGVLPLQRNEADPVAPRGLTPLGTPQEKQLSPRVETDQAGTQLLTNTAPTTAEKVLPEGSHEIVVVAEEMCWLLAKADGAVTRETTLRKGETFTMPFKKSLSLRLGNAGGVNIEFDGKPMPKAGNLGQVKTVTFPPKS